MPQRSPVTRRLAAIAPAFILMTVLIGAWELYAHAGSLGDDVLPGPSTIVTAGWEDRASLITNLWPTLTEVALGFALSLTTAFLLSIALDRSVIVRNAVTPLLVASQTLPIVVLAPLVVIWFGFGLLPKILLVALVTFFPIVVGLVDGYRSSERDATTLLRTMGAGWWTTFRLVRLPSALPGFFTALRISITYAVVAAIFAEYAGAEEGLGIYMQSAKGSFRTDLVLAAVLVSSALTLTLYSLTYLVQRAVIPWYVPSKDTHR